MSVRSIHVTRTTPAHLVSTTARGKVVYVNEVFKGSVEPMKAAGFFTVRDIERHLISNPDDPDGLWTDEREALVFLARS